MVPAQLLELLNIIHRYPLLINADSDFQESGIPDGETTGLGGNANFLAWSISFTHLA